MTEDKVEAIIPRNSWWTDIRGRVWLILKYSYETQTFLPTGVEMLELYKTIPTYQPLDVILKSIEKGQMKRVII